MNSFEFKALENGLRKEGVLKLIRINASILSDHYPFALFFEHRGMVFNHWTSIDVNISNKYIKDFNYTYNHLLNNLETYKKKIDHLLFSNYYKEALIFDVGHEISKFAHMQICNIHEIRRLNNMTFGVSPGTREDFYKSFVKCLKDKKNAIDSYEQTLNNFPMANLKNVSHLFMNN